MTRQMLYRPVPRIVTGAVEGGANDIEHARLQASVETDIRIDVVIAILSVLGFTVSIGSQLLSQKPEK